MVNKITKTIIKENAESTSQKKAMEYAEKEMGLDKESAEEYVRKTLRSLFPYLNGNSKAGKYTFGLIRLANTEVKSRNDRMKLNSFVEVLVNNQELYAKIDNNFNKKSFKELSKMMQDYIVQDDKSKSKSKPKTSSQYTIRAINSYSDANEYCGKFPWCICSSMERFESYSDMGMSQFYFAIRKDYTKYRDNDTVVLETERGHKLNAYALSALAICVTPEGKLKSCTTRLNHENDCDYNSCGDHELTVEEIEKVVGVNFYEAFKPNKKCEQIIKTINGVKDKFTKCKTEKELKELMDKYIKYVGDYDYDSNYFSSLHLNDGSEFYYRTYDEFIDDDIENQKISFAFECKDGTCSSHNYKPVAYYVNDGLLKCYFDGKIVNISPINEAIDDMIIRFVNENEFCSCCVTIDNYVLLFYNPILKKIYKFNPKKTGEHHLYLGRVDGLVQMQIEKDDFDMDFDDDETTKIFDTKTMEFKQDYTGDLSIDDLICYNDYLCRSRNGIGEVYTKDLVKVGHCVYLCDNIIYVLDEGIYFVGHDANPIKIKIDSFVRKFKSMTDSATLVKTDKGKICAFIKQNIGDMLRIDNITKVKYSTYNDDIIVKNKNGYYNITAPISKTEDVNALKIDITDRRYEYKGSGNSKIKYNEPIFVSIQDYHDSKINGQYEDEDDNYDDDDYEDYDD